MYLQIDSTKTFPIVRNVDTKGLVSVGSRNPNCDGDFQYDLTVYRK